MRLNVDHRLRMAASGSVRLRLKRVGFRRRALKFYDKYPHLKEQVRDPIHLSCTNPWLRGIAPNIVFSELPGPGVCGRSEEIRLAAISRSCELGAAFNIYSIPTAGRLHGGVSVVITTGDHSDPIVEDCIKEAGASFTNSFEEEKRALEWARDYQ